MTSPNKRNTGHSSTRRRSVDSPSKSDHVRGLPKKGGGGGKGTWGRPGDELKEDTVDKKDPNYDPGESDKEVVIEEHVPKLSDDELKKLLDPILNEYLENGDTDEVLLSLKDATFFSHEATITSNLLSKALDKSDANRELVSVLLADLNSSSTITSSKIGEGIWSLLDSLKELSIDIPDAIVILAKFIARAIADDVLIPKFISQEAARVVDNDPHHLVKQTFQKASDLLNMQHGLVRLSTVWGHGGPQRPVKLLVDQIILLLQEYSSSVDKKEANRCLAELEAPHFHHEFVFQTFLMALENNERTDRLLDLLEYVNKSNLVTRSQMTAGYERIFNDIHEISVDVPTAVAHCKTFTEKSVQHGIVPSSILDLVPAQGRKRYLSEGDGGVVKS